LIRIQQRLVEGDSHGSELRDAPLDLVRVDAGREPRGVLGQPMVRGRRSRLIRGAGSHHRDRRDTGRGNGESRPEA
jgi:hypothetical protein